MLTHSAIRLLRRLLGASPRSEGPYAGKATVLDGTTAVAVTEAGIGEAAGLGAGFPADAAELAWRAEQRRHGTNLAGAPLSSLAAEGPRGALAAAMGLAMSGVRASVFLSGPDLAAGQDLLQAAAGQRLPLVIHVTARTLTAQGRGLGSGHEAVHLAADSGCILLIAANVQEAVDFALIARRTAEQTLTPALVVMDSEQTALSMQDVRLPPQGLVEGYLGSPDDRIPAPTQAQQLLFGDSRRRLPHRQDPDRPVLLGALAPPQIQALGRAASGVFFDAHVATCLDEAFADFAHQTGRTYSPISSHRVEGASLVLVAQGSSVETAELMADRLRRHHRLKVGVIGLRGLRPFPGARLARLLRHGARVCVLERLSTPLADDPPLLRELRAALDRSFEEGHFDGAGDPDPSALDKGRRPRLLSVVYGLGGLPLRPADLAALCRKADDLPLPRVYLGLSFTPPPSVYPKRQVLLDRLRRAHPEIADLGLIGTETGPEPLPDGSLTLALHRIAGGPGDGLTAEAAAQLHRVLGGGLRTRPGLPAAPWGEPCVDRLHLGPDGIKDPGDAPGIDLTISVLDPGLPGIGLADGLVKGGALLIQTRLSDDALWDRLDQAARSAVRDNGCGLYRIAPPQDAALDNEQLLGALCAVLVDRDMLDASPRRLLTVREELLQTAADAPQRLERFRAALDAVHQIDPNTLSGGPSPKTVPTDDEVPALVRRLGRIDDGYGSLSRFWDQVGVLYRNGDTAELTPDPYLALGAIPPLSARFRDLSPSHDRLPILDPALCTGCGACWTGCPDSALSAALLTPARLIEAGIAAVGADALRPIASKLAAGMVKQCRQGSDLPPDAGGLLAAAYAGIKEKLPFADDRKAAIASDIEGVTAVIGRLPLAATGPFFEEPGREGRDGELLALSLEPGACKGCGICAKDCAPGALTMQTQNSRTLEQARLGARTFALLPETLEETTKRARAHPEVGAAAATFLSRRAVGSFSGGDGAEPGSGARVAVRMALGVTESHRASAHVAYLQAVQSAADGIAGLIRGLLADALPADDLDALAQVLETADGGQANLNSLIEVAEDNAGSALDTRRLRRLVGLARRLGDLAWRLAEGRQGIGRATTGLVLTEGASAAFPHNPFAVPVNLDPSGEGAQLAAGVLDGQLRQATADLILLRKANLELTHPDDAARLGPELDALSWRDLDEEERSRCPVLWLVGSTGVLGGRGLAQVVSLLGSDLPVKILILADLDLGLAAPVHAQAQPVPLPDAAGDLALLALSRRGTYIAQSALGVGEHLTETLEQALDHPGPALLHVHAPSPARHGFDTACTLERARSAVAARVFPLFRYQPKREGVFGSRIDLDGNPDPRQLWAGDPESGSLTLAHWALGEARFAELFTPLADEDPAQIPFAELFALEATGRTGKIPFVERADNGSTPRRLRVDQELVRAADERLQDWRMLQELAGLVTPFTERVQREAEDRVAAERKAELATQAAEYEASIQALRTELQQETRQAVRERLMQLAGFDRPTQDSERMN